MKALESAIGETLNEWRAVDKSAVQFVAPYAFAHKEVVPMEQANIATDLGPMLDKVLHAGSRLCVVGYDGASTTKEGYVWGEKISSWLGIGCDVDYLLSSPTPKPEVVEAFSMIARRGAKQATKKAGRLRLFQAKPELPSLLKSQLAAWTTFHFAVSDEPVTLWIETNHPTSEPLAYDCFFFPEKAAKESGLGEVYLGQFNRAMGQACVEIPLTK